MTDLYRLFCELGDGIAWNPQALTVTFEGSESARQFKAVAPCWTVQYLRSGSKQPVTPHPRPVA